MEYKGKQERAAEKFAEIAEFEKQERARLQKLAMENRTWTNRLGETEDTLVDKPSFYEKYALYHATTPYDIEHLSHDDKQVLLDVLTNALYQLSFAKNHGSWTLQNRFLEGIEARLNMKRDISKGPKLELVIGQVDSKKAEKAILQTFMEMMFMSHNDHSYLIESVEHIECFEFAGKRTAIILEIQKNIDAYVKAAGVVGLSEKYFRV